MSTQALMDIMQKYRKESYALNTQGNIHDHVLHTSKITHVTWDIEELGAHNYFVGVGGHVRNIFMPKNINQVMTCQTKCFIMTTVFY